MSRQVVTILLVLVTWWSSTGLILLLDRLPRATFRYSMAAMSLLAVGGLYGLWAFRDSTSVSAVYLSFGCALLVWAWHELTFLLGLVVGPYKTPCPSDARGWRRFGLATATIIYHELALALTLAIVFALSWNGTNRVGAWTYLVLWTMRLSAKLNVYLGVPNLTTEFIPDHLRYLLSYCRKRRGNALMPLSILIGGAVVFGMTRGLSSGEMPAFVATGRVVVATMLALAVLEHLFLAAPLPDALLWRWLLRIGHAANKAPKKAPVQAVSVEVAEARVEVYDELGSLATKA